MLTETQYNVLAQFRDGDIPLEDLDGAIVKSLIENGYIHRFQYVLPNGNIGKTIMGSITETGEDALRNFEHDVENQRKEEAKRASEEATNKCQIALDKRKSIKHDLIIASVGSAIGGLVVLAVQKILGLI